MKSNYPRDVSKMNVSFQLETNNLDIGYHKLEN
jgi:hypothetical protein